jgi:outer membrane protein TolC
LEAAENASAAVLEAYQHGLGTYTEVVTNQRNVAAAQSVNYETRAAIHSGAAALALSVGDLARPSMLPDPKVKPSREKTISRFRNR